ncbi:MAG: tRNA (adenosine(37)-N6)-threonylcarbamoyltransferase complex ATPase subunit type 1 TsaE [Gammaproteobacteria bacterium]|jgi:tRNA threonylcarbamoyladenosine biosynthesis protein TsaE
MHSNILTIFLPDEAATIELGAKLAKIVPNNFVIYLYGELGAGKTTLVRGFLQSLGHIGRVKSPTYTLMETYQTANKTIHHLDLYRLTNPEELNFIGIRDYAEQDIWLIEWPKNGEGFLPEANLCCYLETEKSGRIVHFEEKNTDIISKLEL